MFLNIILRVYNSYEYYFKSYEGYHRYFLIIIKKNYLHLHTLWVWEKTYFFWHILLIEGRSFLRLGIVHFYVSRNVISNVIFNT